MKLRSIDLFSGSGGITLALEEHCEPIIYCDNEKFSQALLYSRMESGHLPFAPIWTDVRTLNGEVFKGLVDIIMGGFPCQDISNAGAYDPSIDDNFMEKERSGLFKEIIRLAQEAEPTFLFLENVAAIRTRGLVEVQEELSRIGYDCRWGIIAASEIGAPHERERWFCLAIRRSVLADTSCEGLQGQRKESNGVQPELSEPHGEDCNEREVADTFSTRCEGQGGVSNSFGGKAYERWKADGAGVYGFPELWLSEPKVGRVANGVACRVDRIKTLGNGVVPLQVKVAFETLMGLL